MAVVSSYPIVGRVAGDFLLGTNAAGTVQRFAESGRDKLSGSRTYYVRTDGNNANTGLGNNAGAAWASMAHAYAWISSNLDQAGYSVAVYVGPGAYTSGIQTDIPTTGPVVFDGTDKSLVSVHAAAGDVFSFNMKWFGPRVSFRNMRLTSAGANVIAGHNNANLGWGGIDFGPAPAGSHVVSNGGSKVYYETGNDIISGSAVVHLYCSSGAGMIEYIVPNVTITGTPAFTWFAGCFAQSLITAYQPVFTNAGAVTGTRFAVGSQGYINAFGGGPNLFPGSSPGTPDAATFGLYA